MGRNFGAARRVLALLSGLLLVAVTPATSRAQDDAVAALRPCIEAKDASTCIADKALSNMPTAIGDNYRRLLGFPPSQSMAQALLSVTPSSEVAAQSLATDAVWRERNGASPDQALSAITSETGDSQDFRRRVIAYGSVCNLARAARASSLGYEPNLLVRKQVAPSTSLTHAAMERWEAELTAVKAQASSDQAGDITTVLALCWGMIGEGARADHLYMSGSTPDDLARINRIRRMATTRLKVLSAELRLSESVDFARTATVSPDAQPGPFPMWTVLQQQRVQVMATAVSAGHLDLAHGAALAILAAVRAPDHPYPANEPMRRLADTGAERALAFLIEHGFRKDAESEIQSLQPLVGPGGRYFNGEDCVAVYRALVALGHTDQAKALFEAVSAQSAEERNTDRFLAEMQSSDGRWDKALKLGFEAHNLLAWDLVWDPQGRNLDSILAKAKSDDDREATLSLCAAPDKLFRAFPVVGSHMDAPLALEVSAGCARKMTLPGLAALTVAERAGQAGNLELMREMRARAIEGWKPQPMDADMTLVMETFLDLSVRERAGTGASGAKPGR
jgi:hypothetical protein